MKKFTLIALSFILSIALLAGCRSKAPEETAGPTEKPTTPATQAPTSATTPATTPATQPTTGATDGTENGRGAIMQPRAY